MTGLAMKTGMEEFRCKAVLALAFQDRNAEVMLPVLEHGAVAHQSVAGVDAFGQLRLSGRSRRPRGWLQRG